MIKHIVLLPFNNDVTQQQIDHLENGLKKITLELPEIHSLSFGKNCSSEGLEKGHSYGFVMEFNSVGDRDFYLKHPDHVAFANNVIIPMVNKNGGALVLDY